MYYTYLAPDGNDISRVSTDKMCELLESSDLSYWETGSGDAALRSENSNVQGELIIIVRSIGVYVQYTEKRTAKEWALSTDRDENASVTITLAG